MADIELVIKMPEDEYRNILLTGKASFCAINAIEAGTPLPKGHGALKDISRLSYNCMYNYSSECKHEVCNTCQFNCVAKYEIEDTPTILEADTGSEDAE